MNDRNLQSHLSDDIQRSVEAIAEEVHPPGEDTKEPSTGLDKELALESNQEELFRAVNAALERMDAGTYGRCTVCGARISQTRLEAIPYAPYCLDCERNQEAQLGE
jgi:RNA polymerase-binding transcription factor DksA